MSVFVALLPRPLGLTSGHEASLCLRVHGEVGVRLEHERVKCGADVAMLGLLISWGPAAIAALSVTSCWAYRAHRLRSRPAHSSHNPFFFT